MTPEQSAILRNIATIIWWGRKSPRWQGILKAHWDDFEALAGPMPALNLLEQDIEALNTELAKLEKENQWP